MSIKTGYGVTTLVNGEVQPNFTTEKTNNNTTIGKMINSVNALLTSKGIKGTGGAVGTYDSTILGEACYRIVHGSLSENVYGETITAEYFYRNRLL